MATAKSIVVGIDGSRAAVAAAQWGADKASGHDVALRLLYVIDRRRGFTPNVIKAQSSLAEAALQDALVAVETARNHSRVQLEVQLETVDGDPGTVLTEASWSAALLCVGSPKAAPHGPSDSLAASMARSARCSVAIVPATQYSMQPRAGWIATLLNSSTSDYDVLQQAMEEAQLRELPLRVVTNWRRTASATDDHAGAEDSTTIEDSLVNWTQCYPGLDMRVVHIDQFLRYVMEHQASIRSVVLGAEHHHDVAQLVELTRARALHDANFSVFVIRGPRL